MLKKIIIISAIFCGIVVLLFSVRTNAMTPEGAFELIKLKLFGDKTAAPVDNAAQIKKAAEYAQQLKEKMSANTGEMTIDKWVEITVRLRCADAAVVNETQTNSIMSQFGVTAAQYAAFAWQFSSQNIGDNSLNYKEINKRYEDKYRELVSSGNCGTTTTAIQGMDDVKWIEITALLMCLTDVSDVEIKHGWIFSKYGININEFAEYGKKVKVRADYESMKEKTRARYWTLLGSRVCDKLNETAGVSSGTMPYVPFLMDDQNLWDYLKLKVKNLGCKIGLKVEGMNCSPVPTEASGELPALPTTTVIGDQTDDEQVVPVIVKDTRWKRLKCKIKNFFGKKCE